MDRDYISPNLSVVTPDAGFPHMRPGDRIGHPWKYLRREVPHIWYADERFPLMGFLNRDEAILLYNIALQFKGRRALEIGSWLGWSTCHLALAGVDLDVIDSAHSDPAFRAIVEESLARSGVAANLTGCRSPEGVHELASKLGRKWSLFFIDGDHEGAAPVVDTLACLSYAEDDCAFVFHDLASPDVAAGLFTLQERGFNVILYQTAQIMGMAWRGDVQPVAHTPDPEVLWQVPQHLVGLPTSFNGALSSVRVDYARLSEYTYPSQSALKPRVCIVTNEIIGPFKNGGIGTSMTGLAQTLAAAGLPVTVLYTGSVWSPDVSLRRWKKHYAELGIELVALSIEEMNSLAGPLRDCGFGVPYLVYAYLKASNFDVVHFNDCCGEGMLALAAKKLGIAFEKTLLVVALHSPSQWVLELNQSPPANPIMAAYNPAERLSVQYADVLWSPSRYMLDWAEMHEFTFPPQTFVQQYSVPLPARIDRISLKSVREIVFFGRLEERKGLRLFCDALDGLMNLQISVTFLGKPGQCDGMDSLEFIRRRRAQWRFPAKTITDLDQPEALTYLSSGERLAVMASPADNSPCTVYEALECGIPFLAARTGGIPELIEPESRERVLFDCTVDSLRAALLNAIEHGAAVAKPAIPQDDIRRSWTKMHAHWETFLSTRPATSYRGLQLVAIVDHHRGNDLAATLKSLEVCYAMRLIVVLNRSGEAMPSCAVPVRNVDVRSQTIDRLLDELAGDALLLVRSGFVVKSDAIVTMLTAFDGQNLDGLAPAAESDTKIRVRVVPPLGGSPSFSLYYGAAFTGGLLIRGTALLRAKGARTLVIDSEFLGLADLCVARGVEILPWPEPLFEFPGEYKRVPQNSAPGRLALYIECSPLDRYYMVSIGYAASNGHNGSSSKRELAMELVRLGLGPVVRLGLWGMRQVRAVRSRVRSAIAR